jgi:2-phosphoglycerate kinase
MCVNSALISPDDRFHNDSRHHDRTGMAKLQVENPEEGTQVPFLRGILIRTLQDAGLSFDEAMTLASDIRAQLSNTAVITTDALRDRVIARLQKSRNPNLVLRYQQRKIANIIHVEGNDGQLTAFSPTEYRHSLETIGLKHEEALEIMEAVSAQLMKQEPGVVSSKYIARFTYRLLRKSHNIGPAVAHRWLVWRDFVRSGKPIIFLIGGTAGCGKSTTATYLASRLDIVRAQSTDMLREVMRTMIPGHIQPVLHTSSFQAWTGLPSSASGSEEDMEQLLIDGYCAQAELLSMAIRAVINRALHERVSLIVEGVHINPLFLGRLVDSKRIAESGAVIVPIMLGVLKRKQLQRRIKGRSTDVPQRRANRYLKYFDNIWKLQSYLMSEADTAQVPIITNENREEVFREIMLTTITKLAEDFDKTPEQVFASS